MITIISLSAIGANVSVEMKLPTIMIGNENQTAMQIVLEKTGENVEVPGEMPFTLLEQVMLYFISTVIFLTSESFLAICFVFS